MIRYPIPTTKWLAWDKIVSLPTQGAGGCLRLPLIQCLPTESEIDAIVHETNAIH
jgi:hypothetical protein